MVPTPPASTSANWRVRLFGLGSPDHDGWRRSSAVEHTTHNRVVPGSNPGAATNHEMNPTLADRVLRLARPRLLRELTRAWAPPSGSRILVAVSGGGDSIALLHLLAALSRGRHWDLVVGTIDHGLRGDQGAEDCRFVREAAAEWNVPVKCARLDLSVREGRSVEAPARRARRAALRRMAAECRAETIALAHTENDQAETLLDRLGRGAGMAGLGAMARHRDGLWRPLLSTRRRVLRNLLHDADLSWRDDPTNLERTALRNRIRHDLLPVVEEILGERAITSLARAAAVSADDETLLSDESRNAARKIVSRPEERCVLLERKPLLGLPPSLIRRILRDAFAGLADHGTSLNAKHLEALESLLRADGPGTHLDLPSRISASRRGSRLRLTRSTTSPSESG